MSPTLPFAGTTVPAEGVFHFVRAILKSPSLEEGLRLLLDAIVGNEAVPAGLWVWPEPSVAALGLVGMPQLYEVRHEELAIVPPTGRSLIEWTSSVHRAQPSVSPTLDANRPGADAHRLTSGSLWFCVPLGAVGAICLPSTFPPLSAEEQHWYGTWLEWLAGREHQVRDAKLRSLAEFAGGAGHEINNPLGTILGRSQLLLRQEADPERRRWLAAIGGQALRIRDMISDTMVFARPPAPKPRPVEIEPHIRSVIDRFAEELSAAHTHLQLQLWPSTLHPQRSTLTASVDPEQFPVVLIELIRNAMRAVSDGGRIGLRARHRNWQGRDWLELDLLNNGPELTAAEREHAFDPFFSGRDAGRGLGFGLTKCWRIITGHGGHIGVHSTPEMTVFRSLWPCESPAGPH